MKLRGRVARAQVVGLWLNLPGPNQNLPPHRPAGNAVTWIAHTLARAVTVGSLAPAVGARADRPRHVAS